MKKQVLAIGLSAAALAMVICGAFAFRSRHQSSTLEHHIARLRPGMTKSNVLMIVPSGYFIEEVPTTNALWNTSLFLTNTSLRSYLHYSRVPSFLLGSPEFAYLYVDTTEQFVGVKYSSQGPP